MRDQWSDQPTDQPLSDGRTNPLVELQFATKDFQNTGQLFDRCRDAPDLTFLYMRFIHNVTEDHLVLPALQILAFFSSSSRFMISNLRQFSARKVIFMPLKCVFI